MKSATEQEITLFLSHLRTRMKYDQCDLHTALSFAIGECRGEISHEGEIAIIRAIMDSDKT